MSVVSLEICENIGIVIINNPPVNALSHAVRSGVSEKLIDAENDETIEKILIICEGRTFCAGADISEFGKPPVSPTLPELMTQMDKVNKPMIAAIHGTALGGGFELSLCCHYRVLDKNAKVGLPEVNLGLIPGAGGTQRLPRLIGAARALDMICTGKSISADKALSLGVADSLSENDLKKDAIEFAKSCDDIKRIKDMTVQIEGNIFQDYEKKIARRSRGFLAPFSAIKAVEAATKMDFDAGIQFERDEFSTLVSSSHSKAQRHLFFAERTASKVPGIDKDTPIRDIKQVAVIGGGIMGCGIAVNFLNKGLPVKLLEISEEGAEAAKAKVDKIYSSTVAKGRMSEDQKEVALSLLETTTNYDDLSSVDLAIEAVFEDLAIKEKVFKELDRVTKKGAILATNTSFLDVDKIAAATSRPEDVIGLHFFSPAHIMPLLEIVRTEQNDASVIATALKIGKMIGKTSVISGVCYGFIANRMSSAYGREAGLLLFEGASVEQVDKAMFDFGMPMGMFTMLDMAGIDIGVMARQKMEHSSYDERAFSIHSALVENGNKGQKTGSGFYVYEDKQKVPNPDVQKYAEEFADQYGIKRREINEDEIRERCVFALINEGFKIVEEGIAQRTSDVDVVYCQGFGFPRYRGGPLHYAEEVGLDYIIKRIGDFAIECGDRWWRPSDLLVKMANGEK